MSRVLRSSIRENKSENVTPRPERNKRVFSVLPSVPSNLTKTPTRRLTQAKRLQSFDTPQEVNTSTASKSPKQDLVHTPDKSKIPDIPKEISSTTDRSPSSTECQSHIPNKTNQPSSDKVNDLIVGRKDEINRLTSLIQSYIDTRKSASFYVSGAPGTGKTAVVLHVVQNFNKAGGCDTAVVNCMQLTSCTDIYSRIAAILKGYGDKENYSVTDAASLECYLNKYSQKRTVILILDEVDQLSTRGQELLYRIFEWPSKLSCHIIIIGVANSLDLPERLLPKLKSKTYKPVHIVFKPYSQSELAEIVQAHLSRTVNSGSCMEPLAIQLCSRKIAASTGDARTALDVCRRAIDLAHQEARLKDMPNKFTPLNPAVDSPRTPSIQHISRALKESQVDSPRPATPFNSNGTTTTTTNGSELPLHHKLLLASCLLLRQQKSLRELSFNMLYETYTSICKKKKITNLDESELSAVCDLLDSRGFIQLTGPRYSIKATLGTPARLRRIRLRLDDRGVQQALMDDLLLSSIMDMKLDKL
ncbi:unnamed protein product [Trichobilharzia szidati]|nr:unnamed protein product [Trichobilharzia szidati]